MKFDVNSEQSRQSSHRMKLLTDHLLLQYFTMNATSNQSEGRYRALQNCRNSTTETCDRIA